jgi:hypothetical protein
LELHRTNFPGSKHLQNGIALSISPSEMEFSLPKRKHFCESVKSLKIENSLEKPTPVKPV